MESGEDGWRAEVREEEVGEDFPSHPAAGWLGAGLCLSGGERGVGGRRLSSELSGTAMDTDGCLSVVSVGRGLALAIPGVSGSSFSAAVAGVAVSSSSLKGVRSAS